MSKRHSYSVLNRRKADQELGREYKQHMKRCRAVAMGEKVAPGVEGAEVEAALSAEGRKIRAAEQQVISRAKVVREEREGKRHMFVEVEAREEREGYAPRMVMKFQHVAQCERCRRQRIAGARLAAMAPGLGAIVRTASRVLRKAKRR